MRATIMYGAGDVRVEEVPDAHLIEATDALVRISHAAICGSDLWPYKSMEPTDSGRRMGHEFIGVVEDIGADVRTVKPGDLVVSPFLWSDGTCLFCREGLQSECLHGGRYGFDNVDGGQGEAVRVPQADGTLVVLPIHEDDELMPSLLTLSDVMGTGHHAAVAAKVSQGKTAAVVGDGAVGLCGVIASKRLGADQIILLGSNPARIALGQEFGATDVVRERGDEAVERVRELTGGLGAHSVLECVGLEQALDTPRWRSHVLAAQLAASESPSTTPRRPASHSGKTRALPEVRRRCARTSRSCCPTSSKVGSSPGAFSTAPDPLTRCPRDTGS
jgi:threonine dehydrogenase-like Zn-dependent dehydrogenase